MEGFSEAAKDVLYYYPLNPRKASHDRPGYEYSTYHSLGPGLLDSTFSSVLDMVHLAV